MCPKSTEYVAETRRICVWKAQNMWPKHSKYVSKKHRLCGWISRCPSCEPNILNIEFTVWHLTQFIFQWSQSFVILSLNLSFWLDSRWKSFLCVCSWCSLTYLKVWTSKIWICWSSIIWIIWWPKNWIVWSKSSVIWSSRLEVIFSSEILRIFLILTYVLWIEHLKYELSKFLVIWSSRIQGIHSFKIWMILYSSIVIYNLNRHISWYKCVYWDLHRPLIVYLISCFVAPHGISQVDERKRTCRHQPGAQWAAAELAQPSWCPACGRGACASSGRTPFSSPPFFALRTQSSWVLLAAQFSNYVLAN